MGIWMKNCSTCGGGFGRRIWNGNQDGHLWSSAAETSPDKKMKNKSVAVTRMSGTSPSLFHLPMRLEAGNPREARSTQDCRTLNSPLSSLVSVRVARDCVTRVFWQATMHYGPCSRTCVMFHEITFYKNALRPIAATICTWTCTWLEQ